VTRSCEPLDVERFRVLVGRCLGLQLGEAQQSALVDVLRRRLDVDGGSPDGYLDRLESPELSREERRALAKELTVGETYFFRDADQLRAFSASALPERLHARSEVRRLRILSAGCASGEEPYSLAMLIQEHSEAMAWDVSIRAVDVNVKMLEKARRACYSAWSLRATPAEVQKRWFHQRDGEFVLENSVRRMVSFEERNLAEEDPALWQPERFDVVFCRNLLMYFTSDSARALVGRIARSLTRGGVLFLGHAETLRGLSQEFHLLHTHGAFYYQRKGAPVADSVDSRLRAPNRSPLECGPPLATFLQETDSWVETIHRAAERVRTLTEATARSGSIAPQSGQRDGATRPVWDLSQAIELLQREQYSESLAVVRALPPESMHDPDVLLLRAVLLTHSGSLVEAAQTCTEALRIDELNAAAHYLLALCREGLGDHKAAMDHDEVAIYLDPSFAMSHLHLGLLARRAGDRRTLRRELEQALVLLQQEEASRLLLFGGGFSREALVGLCRAELAICGNVP